MLEFLKSISFLQILTNAIFASACGNVVDHMLLPSFVVYLCSLYSFSNCTEYNFFFYYSDSVKEVNLFDSFCVEFLSIVCDCSKYS